MALASCELQDKAIDIGDGLILEISPRTFETIVDNTRCERLLTAIERGEIPDTLDPQTETVIVQEGFRDAVVTPIVYNRDGSVKTAAKAKLIITPAVNKPVTPPVIKTPLPDVQSKPRLLCKPITRRIILKPKAYEVKNKSGATIKRFETADALANYINSK